MNSVKYLDIDSSFRNRNNFPNPADFVIPITYPGRDGTSATAIDPVVSAVRYSGSSLPGPLKVGNGSTTTQVTLDSSEPNIDNYYINSVLEIGTDFRTITQYSAATNQVTLSSPLSAAPAAGTLYYTRLSSPFLLTTVASVISPTMITLASNTPGIQGNYVNNYFYLRDGNASGLGGRIIAYNGNTRTVTLASPLAILPSVGDGVELDAFTEDNASTLISSGNVNQGSQNSQFEIELLWLSVPNITLNVGHGGKLDSYPYLYVALYNEGNSLSNQVMYSNNPNSSSMLFCVPCCEYFGDTSFVTLKDCKMKQTVSFRPDQDIRFSIYLPDGTVVQFSQSDNASPQTPNPLLQFNAVFSLRKI